MWLGTSVFSLFPLLTVGSGGHESGLRGGADGDTRTERGRRRLACGACQAQRREAEVLRTGLLEARRRVEELELLGGDLGVVLCAVEAGLAGGQAHEDVRDGGELADEEADVLVGLLL